MVECWRLGEAIALAALYRYVRQLWGHGDLTDW